MTVLDYVIDKHVLCSLFIFNHDKISRTLDIIVPYGCEVKEKWEGGLCLISKKFQNICVST